MGKLYLIIVDNIEVLFQSSLKLQPLEILKILSYDRVVIASFPGRILEGALVYAEASHAEYEVFPQYEIKDFILLDLNGEQK